MLELHNVPPHKAFNMPVEPNLWSEVVGGAHRHIIGVSDTLIREQYGFTVHRRAQPVVAAGGLVSQELMSRVAELTQRDAKRSQRETEWDRQMQWMSEMISR